MASETLATTLREGRPATTDSVLLEIILLRQPAESHAMFKQLAAGVKDAHSTLHGATMFASRKIAHFPSGCLRRIDRAGPDSRRGFSPPGGCTVIVNSFQQ